MTSGLHVLFIINLGSDKKVKPILKLTLKLKLLGYMLLISMTTENQIIPFFK